VQEQPHQALLSEDMKDQPLVPRMTTPHIVFPREPASSAILATPLLLVREGGHQLESTALRVSRDFRAELPTSSRSPLTTQSEGKRTFAFPFRRKESPRSEEAIHESRIAPPSSGTCNLPSGIASDVRTKAEDLSTSSSSPIPTQLRQEHTFAFPFRRKELDLRDETHHESRIAPSFAPERKAAVPEVIPAIPSANIGEVIATVPEVTELDCLRRQLEQATAVQNQLQSALEEERRKSTIAEELLERSRLQAEEGLRERDRARRALEEAHRLNVTAEEELRRLCSQAVETRGENLQLQMNLEDERRRTAAGEDELRQLRLDKDTCAQEQVELLRRATRAEEAFETLRLSMRMLVS
jgi:hypothetical protein